MKRMKTHNSPLPICLYHAAISQHTERLTDFVANLRCRQ